jgi:hypothetical protein
MNGNSSKQKVSLLLGSDLIKIAKEHTEVQKLSFTDLVEKALLEYFNQSNLTR